MAKEYIKPQSPMHNGDAYIYPLTTADQVVKSNGSKLEVNGAINADLFDGKPALSFASKEDLNNQVPFKFGIDENGNYGYIKDGADTVTPFNSLNNFDILYEIQTVSGANGTVHSGYKALEYTLTEADIKKYSNYLFLMTTLGCNNISYSGISDISLPENAIALSNFTGLGDAGAVSGSNGDLDYAICYYLIPKQYKTSTFSISGRGVLTARVIGFY